jgi:dTDP-4-dehydrorhamnose reductase
MVGRALAEYCVLEGDRVAALSREQLDIAEESAVSDAFKVLEPDVVFNCGAYTNVDACETEIDRAFRVNALGPEILARQAREAQAALMTISTDYVFDGTKTGFYDQRDDPAPLSVYGSSKREGEIRALTTYARTSVIRTGWIFGLGGTNFLSRAVEFGTTNSEVTAISDSYGTPTYAWDLARRMREIAVRDVPGIYHVSNSGDGASFEGFVRKSLQLAGLDASRIRPVTMDSMKRPAPRPRNSRLGCLISGPLGLGPLPHWEEALSQFVEKVGQQRDKYME